MKSKCVLNMIDEINALSKDWIKKEVNALNLPVLVNHIPLFYILPDDGGAMEFREIREYWKISKSSLSDLLNKYEALGYIEKKSTCEDKRCVMISLTKEGLAVKKEFLAIESKILGTMVAGFSLEAREQLETSIVTILSNIKNAK